VRAFSVKDFLRKPYGTGWLLETLRDTLEEKTGRGV
jgi:hypothetical protein